MKNVKKILILALVLSALLCVNAFAAEIGEITDKAAGVTADVLTKNVDGEEKKVAVEFEYSGVTKDNMYLVLILEAEEGEVPDRPTAGNILYVNQATADSDTITFDNLYPSEVKESYIFLAGADMDYSKPLAKINLASDPGVEVSGTVKSYNPNNEITIALKQSGEVKFSGTIAANTGSGQVTQNFAISGVAAGTYDLVIAKSAHLTYTINGVVVGDSALVLDSVTLLTGDVNADGLINVTDLNAVWNAANYNKPKADAGNGVTDLNGDDLINVTDLNIVWNVAHYNKGVADCTDTY